MPDLALEVLRQHLIDPEICIRCNTCEETCPVDAVTHDSRNYVVDPAKCNFCNDCIAPCPTGRHRQLAAGRQGEALHARRAVRLGQPAGAAELAAGTAPEVPSDVARITSVATAGQGGDVAPPWSAAHPYVNLYRSREAGDRDGQRKFPPDRRRRFERHPPHRARFRRRGVSGARGPDHRHPPARRRRERQAASRAPVFGREPARRRAPDATTTSR